ncbi:dual specificity calcium/calmodulin-dependent 3',5'-cyclic nucleotide phosphodiesterase 1-like [Lagopus muta]|uniref:dual specificity calcium/calmodulin-dependent 3',5'-cyclic nucleotide phosphodiesterase 1-like n=1 Tax=Lagopus muta TaxID=64668 RepID=UPI00209E7C37|nr:dual specificity calcium/calmodulin-dependent 3',5'-cyclic nucleotide phosphodiesterase 1-like [Lagopus muta]
MRSRKQRTPAVPRIGQEVAAETTERTFPTGLGRSGLCAVRTGEEHEVRSGGVVGGKTKKKEGNYSKRRRAVPGRGGASGRVVALRAPAPFLPPHPLPSSAPRGKWLGWDSGRAGAAQPAEEEARGIPGAAIGPCREARRRRSRAVPGGAQQRDRRHWVHAAVQQKSVKQKTEAEEAPPGEVKVKETPAAAVVGKEAIPAEPDEPTEQAANVDKWSFDVFAQNDASGDHALKFILYELLPRYDLINRFKIPISALVSFVEALEVGYSKHNLMHAADVTQTVHDLLFKTGVVVPGTGVGILNM